MANHKSAKKRIRTSERRRDVNKAADSKIKTYMKKALSATDKAEAEKLYKEAVALLDKSSVKGRMPKNTVSRRKATLTKYYNSLTVAAPPAATK